MKRLFPIFIIAVFVGCSGANKITQEMYPMMHFEPKIIDLGVIKKGEDRNMIFPFVNLGKENIEIELATGCKCSEIIAPVGRIFKPGEKGEIKVIFHSDLEEDLGAMTKVIDVLLKNIEPESGYQVVKEVKYKVTLEE